MVGYLAGCFQTSISVHVWVFGGLRLRVFVLEVEGYGVD